MSDEIKKNDGQPSGDPFDSSVFEGELEIDVEPIESSAVEDDASATPITEEKTDSVEAQSEVSEETVETEGEIVLEAEEAVAVDAETEDEAPETELEAAIRQAEEDKQRQEDERIAAARRVEEEKAESKRLKEEEKLQKKREKLDAKEEKRRLKDSTPAEDDKKPKTDKKEARKARDKKKKGGFFSKLKKSIKDVFGELKNVAWPKFPLVVKKTGVVLTVTVAFLLVLMLIDFGLGELYDVLISGLK